MKKLERVKEISKVQSLSEWPWCHNIDVALLTANKKTEFKYYIQYIITIFSDFFSLDLMQNVFYFDLPVNESTESNCYCLSVYFSSAANCLGVEILDVFFWNLNITMNKFKLSKFGSFFNRAKVCFLNHFIHQIWFTTF